MLKKNFWASYQRYQEFIPDKTYCRTSGIPLAFRTMRCYTPHSNA